MNNSIVRISNIVLFILCFSFYGISQNEDPHYTIEQPNVRPWVAAGEVLLNHVVTNRFNSLRPDGDFASISLNSWKDNIKHGMEWDWNNFSTNWIGHPYQGMTYFNSARSLGLSFEASSLYVLGGSLTWEYFGETHRASYNDVVCTTFGGIFLGETTHRLTENILDDRTRGFSRFWREGLTFLIAPTKEINRLITGRAWNKTTKSGHVSIPLRTRLYLGTNIIGKNLFDLSNKPHLTASFLMNYGETMMDFETTYRPFEFFELLASMRFQNIDDSKNRTLTISGYGSLYGQQYKDNKIIGIFLGYDFINVDNIEIGSVSLPFGYLKEFSENDDKSITLEIKAGPHFGSSNTEYIDSIEIVSEDPEILRDYSFSIGTVFNSKFEYISNSFNASVRYAHFWMNVISGPSGNDNLSVLILRGDKNVWDRVSLGLQYTAYFRNSKYDFYEDQKQYFSQINLVLGYKFYPELSPYNRKVMY